MRKKRIIKIYNTLNKIAQKGQEAVIEYNRFIDDTINGDEYSILVDVFDTYYYFDITKLDSVTSLKKETFKIVKSFTYNNFQNNIQNLYKKYNVYQIGTHIYKNSDNSLLGQFIEMNKLSTVNYLGITYSYISTIDYYKNPELLAKLNKSKPTTLRVIIGNDLNNYIDLFIYISIGYFEEELLTQNNNRYIRQNSVSTTFI
jgi:hypothetical protein